MRLVVDGWHGEMFSEVRDPTVLLLGVVVVIHGHVKQSVPNSVRGE
jgi:hypothetical protein